MSKNILKGLIDVEFKKVDGVNNYVRSGTDEIMTGKFESVCIGGMDYPLKWGYQKNPVNWFTEAFFTVKVFGADWDIGLSEWMEKKGKKVVTVKLNNQEEN